MIPVTRPFLPPRQEYEALLDGIWERIWLTNNGPLVHQFEEQVAARLELARPLYVASGTLALQLAMKALELQGDVVTTPFGSHVWDRRHARVRHAVRHRRARRHRSSARHPGHL